MAQMAIVIKVPIPPHKSLFMAEPPRTVAPYAHEKIVRRPLREFNAASASHNGGVCHLAAHSALEVPIRTYSFRASARLLLTGPVTLFSESTSIQRMVPLLSINTSVG